MNPEQIAYARKISDLREYVGQVQETLNKLIRECKHLIVEMKDFGGAYCDICGESFGWYCEQSPTKYCQFSVHFVGCKHCGKPKERK